MKWIEIAKKKFSIGSRLARMFALYVDILCLLAAQTFLFFLSSGFYSFFSIGFFGLPSAALWIIGLLGMDGMMNGRGIGKRLLSLQVVRLKDGKPCSFKDSIVRRLVGIFQPFDLLFTLGKNKQRMGDKLANTVVVQYRPYPIEVEDRVEDTETVLENAIIEISNRLSEARQKVDASIGIEKQFQDAYEGAIVQAERCEERATIAIRAGREDLAREDIAQRNEYRQHANQYKRQWDEQKRVVTELTTLLETLNRKTEEAERKRDIVIAQNRNIDAHQHLKETLSEVQENEAFEILNQMEQNASEAASLAKAASAVESELRNPALNTEFTTYAEEASIDNDLTELKSKIQSEGT